LLDFGLVSTSPQSRQLLGSQLDAKLCLPNEGEKAETVAFSTFSCSMLDAIPWGLTAGKIDRCAIACLDRTDVIAF